MWQNLLLLTVFNWAGNIMCSLYSTEQNDFEIEGQEWSVLTRQFKDSHFHNNVTDSDSQSLTQNAVIFYTVMPREIFPESNQQSV